MHFFAGRFHCVAAMFLLIIIYCSSLLRNKKKDASLAFSMSKLLSQRVNLNWFSQQGYVAFFGKLSLSVLAFLYKHVCFHGIRALSKETRHMPMQSGVAPVRGGAWGGWEVEGCSQQCCFSGEPAAGWEASVLVGKASLLEVILVVLLSLKQLCCLTRI